MKRCPRCNALACIVLYCSFVTFIPFSVGQNSIENSSEYNGFSLQYHRAADFHTRNSKTDLPDWYTIKTHNFYNGDVRVFLSPLTLVEVNKGPTLPFTSSAAITTKEGKGRTLAGNLIHVTNLTLNTINTRSAQRHKETSLSHSALHNYKRKIYTPEYLIK
ncbi:hypothetical protein POV27_10110 [Aureisphaera galaxeae]|uniref:hypothetical protein n=1 Tax=Aureisphaera galaxeae TaxID=1538023 RepID=UPI00235082B7|nr:hypothetical protein [Aureisphaera galaxeae]MDC8004406.1 hypothetical protein [Aureisphaera galaxeae]